MHAIDVAILLCFVVYAMGSGLHARAAASEDLTQYFLAGRQLGGIRAGLSMAATQFAADTPLLMTGLIATTGIFGLWRLWIYGCAFLLLGFVLAPSWRRAGVLTDAELSESRYGGRAATWLRGVKAVYFGVVFNCAVLAMVLFAAARIAEPFLIWHAWLPQSLMDPIVALVRSVGVPLTDAADVWIISADNLLSLFLIVFVTGFYSTTGGLRSVVRTDMAQLALALGGTAIYAYYALDAAGGLFGFHSRLATALSHHPTGMTTSELLAFTPGPASDVTRAMLAVLGLQWLIQMNSDGTGYLAQRCMACRSDRDATRATLVFSWTQIVLRSLLWLLIGLSLLVVFSPNGTLHGAAFTADREASYVRGMLVLLPPGVRGLMLTAMLAALASTLDTHINWGASYLTNDLYGRIYCGVFRDREPTPRVLVRVARLSSVLIIALALALMTRLSSIHTAWKISLLLGSGMGVMLLLRWLWWRVTALGEMTCIVTSSVVAPLLVALAPDDREALRLLITAVASTAAGVVVSLARPAKDLAHIVDFYARARPPGFWGPIAARVGEASQQPRLRLYHGLGRAFAAALCLFCTLVALGTWLVGGTTPAWFPIPPLWPPALLLVALISQRFSRLRD